MFCIFSYRKVRESFRIRRYLLRIVFSKRSLSAMRGFIAFYPQKMLLLCLLVGEPKYVWRSRPKTFQFCSGCICFWIWHLLGGYNALNRLIILKNLKKTQVWARITHKKSSRKRSPWIAAICVGLFCSFSQTKCICSSIFVLFYLNYFQIRVRLPFYYIT